MIHKGIFMKIDGSNQCSPWNSEESFRLKHSRLYSLEPIGVGTPEVESLSGYVARLAEAHCVSIAVLCKKEIAPVIKETKSPSASLKYEPKTLEPVFANSIRPMNGMGTIAEDWVRSLEILTLRKELRNLTALAYSEIFSVQNWLRPFRAWCPPCYEEQRESGKIVYEHLSGTLKAITVCPSHQCYLEEICPHCKRHLPVLAPRSLPGHCSKCRQWLGSLSINNSNKHQRNDFDYHIWAAQAAGEFLVKSSEVSFLPSKEGIRTSLASCINYFTGGNISAFCKNLNISNLVISRVLSGNVLIKLDMMLRICYFTNISPTGFLTGKIDFSAHQGPELSVQNCFPNCESFPSKKVSLVLQAALSEEPPPSLSDIAKRLKYKHKSSLYHSHESLSKKVVARYRSFKRMQRKDHRREKVDDSKAEDILKEAINQNPPLSIREVARRIGYSGTVPVRQRFPDLCKELIKRRKEYNKDCSNQIYQTLVVISKEAPPPSFSEVVRRLGHTHSASLTQRFPNICRKITRRFVEFRKKRLRAAQRGLEAAIRSDLPPSLAVLAKKFGYKSARHISRAFPDLCREIIDKRLEFKRSQAEKLRDVLQAILQETPPPSVRSISKRLGYEKGSIYRRYPDLCHKIAARYSNSLNKRKTA